MPFFIESCSIRVPQACSIKTLDFGDYFHNSPCLLIRVDEVVQIYFVDHESITYADNGELSCGDDLADAVDADVQISSSLLHRQQVARRRGGQNIPKWFGESGGSLYCRFGHSFAPGIQSEVPNCEGQTSITEQRQKEPVG
jgi:hypothetical protein